MGTTKGLSVSKYLRSHSSKCLTGLEHSNHNLTSKVHRSAIASQRDGLENFLYIFYD